MENMENLNKNSLKYKFRYLIKDNVGIIYLMVISVIIIYILSFLIMKVWNAISWPFYKKTVNLLSNIKIIE